jgi:hypothetical protein
MKLTAILLATALLLASHVPAFGQLRNVTDGPSGISYNASAKTVSGAYTATKDDHTILANAASAAFTITLPAPHPRTFPYLVVKKIDATNNAVTLNPFGPATIDGNSTLVLGSQWQQVVLHADATAWRIVAGGGLLRGDTVLTSDSTGGNLGAANTLTAGLNVSLVPFATMTNGSTETTSYMDDTPAAEFSAVTVGVAPTDTESSTFARIGSNSLKLAWPATSVAGDGVTATLTSDNLESNESIGLWLYVSEAIAAGDLTLVLTDNGGDRTFNIPAVTTAGVWTWVEVDISSLAAGTGDTITAWKILLSSAGATAHAAFDTYIDGVWKWDAADELALGVDVLDQPGTIRSILTQVKADAGTQAHDMAALVEGTDYFVHRESGNDFLVQITNQSTKSGFGLILHK